MIFGFPQAFVIIHASAHKKNTNLLKCVKTAAARAINRLAGGGRGGKLKMTRLHSYSKEKLHC